MVARLRHRAREIRVGGRQQGDQGQVRPGLIPGAVNLCGSTLRNLFQKMWQQIGAAGSANAEKGDTPKGCFQRGRLEECPGFG